MGKLFNTKKENDEKVDGIDELSNLKSKVLRFNEVLSNTVAYRESWKKTLKEDIISQLEMIIKKTELYAEIETKQDVENLEAIVLNLGQSKSGIYEKVNEEVNRHLIKHHGSLIYQQLFNGKVIVLVNYPMIEGYGQPRPPQTLAIYRPEEVQPPFIIRHVEEFIKEVTNWEDYDDDEPHQKIGFNLNFLEGHRPEQMDG